MIDYDMIKDVPPVESIETLKNENRLLREKIEDLDQTKEALMEENKKLEKDLDDAIKLIEELTEYIKKND